MKIKWNNPLPMAFYTIKSSSLSFKNTGITLLCLCFYFINNLSSQDNNWKSTCLKNKKNNHLLIQLVINSKLLFRDTTTVDTTLFYLDALNNFTYLKKNGREYLKYKSKMYQRDSSNFFKDGLCSFPLGSPLLEFVYFYTGDFDAFSKLHKEYREIKKDDTLVLKSYTKKLDSDTNVHDITTVTQYDRHNQLVKLFSSISLFNDSQVYNVKLTRLDTQEKPEYFKMIEWLRSDSQKIILSNKVQDSLKRNKLKPGDMLFEHINEFATIDSSQVKLEKNKLYLFDFWYMSCYPCIKSFPEIEKFNGFDSLKGKIQVISANCKDKKNEKLNYFIKYHHLNFPVISSFDYFFLNQFRAHPTFVITDYQGKILFIYEGYSPDLFDVLKNKCFELVAQ